MKFFDDIFIYAFLYLFAMGRKSINRINSKNTKDKYSKLKADVDDVLDGYKPSKVKLATVCSHSSLQIFYGAKQEGIKTIGIVRKDLKKLYESFPYGRPDEFIVVDDYSEIPEDELISKNAVIIPHGSFVEYAADSVLKTKVPIFGNRRSLEWERDRLQMFKWLKQSHAKTPKIFEPEQIDRPVLVKFPGAKGGRGYTIVKSYEEFKNEIREKEYMIQEFIVGVRAYPQFFFSPFSKIGYETNNGRIELLGVDKRVESSADEISRAVSAGIRLKMAFTVIGNEPLVLRESLLSRYMEIGKNVSDSSFKLFGGLYGPYCVETIITENLEIYTFEVSARIVAGTNMFPGGSPYSLYYYKEPMSMGRRVAKEIKLGLKLKRLNEIVF